MFKAGVSNPRGFTLVELAMVILVVGIVAAITMPRVGNMLDRRKMERSINVLRGMTRYLQSRAAMTKRIYRLTFDLDRQMVSVCYLTAEGCQPDRNRVTSDYHFPATIEVLDVVNEAGEKIETGEVGTHFHPSGLVEPSLIHLQGANAKRLTLVVEPLTGRLKVVDGYIDRQAS
jgi:general secretion pathway protein H